MLYGWVIHHDRFTAAGPTAPGPQHPIIGVNVGLETYVTVDRNLRRSFLLCRCRLYSAWPRRRPLREKNSATKYILQYSSFCESGHTKQGKKDMQYRAGREATGLHGGQVWPVCTKSYTATIKLPGRVGCPLNAVDLCVAGRPSCALPRLCCVPQSDSNAGGGAKSVLPQSYKRQAKKTRNSCKTKTYLTMSKYNKKGCLVQQYLEIVMFRVTVPTSNPRGFVARRATYLK